MDCYKKVLECIDGEGKLREVREILQPVSVRKISTLQLSKFFKKGYQIYLVHISNPIENKGMKLEDYKLL